MYEFIINNLDAISYVIGFALIYAIFHGLVLAVKAVIDDIREEKRRKYLLARQRAIYGNNLR